MVLPNQSISTTSLLVTSSYLRLVLESQLTASLLKVKILALMKVTTTKMKLELSERRLPMKRTIMKIQILSSFLNLLSFQVLVRLLLHASVLTQEEVLLKKSLTLPPKPHNNKNLLTWLVSSPRLDYTLLF
jgi:hypothetical protein